MVVLVSYKDYVCFFLSVILGFQKTFKNSLKFTIITCIACLAVLRVLFTGVNIENEIILRPYF
jgi:hypothetical protein